MSNKRHPKFISGLLFISVFISCGHIVYQQQNYLPPFMSIAPDWADTTLHYLSLEEKIGQLFILQSNLDQTTHTRRLVNAMRPGGVIISGTTKSNYLEAIHTFRMDSPIPLLEISEELVSINNQFSDKLHYPSNASLSPVSNNYLERSLHRQLVSDCKLLGINASFSPNIQSFKSTFKQQLESANTLELISRASQKVEELQERKILSIANAFDIYLDSIADSTLIKKGFLNDYKPLIISGLSGILIDQKVFEGDSINHRLPEFFKTFLQKHLKFEGLLFGKISEKTTLKELLYAGTDVFIVKEKELEKNVAQLINLVHTELISEAVIDAKVRKILMAKKWLGLDKKVFRKLVENTESNQGNDRSEELLIRSLYEQSLVLTNNPDSIVPLKKHLWQTVQGHPYR